MRILWLLAVLIVGIPSLSLAQEGPYVGLRTGFNSMTFDGDIKYSETEDGASGPGVWVDFGYTFNPLLTLFVSVSGHRLNSGDSHVGNALVGGRFRFLEGGASPYAEIVAGGATFKYADIDARFSGQQVGLGAGFDVFLGRHLTLDVGVRAQRLWLNKVRTGEVTMDIETMKIIQLAPSVGLSFRF